MKLLTVLSGTLLGSLLWPAVSWAQESGGDHSGWVSVLPPLVAIALALALKRVIPAIFLGVWVGAWAASNQAIDGTQGVAGAWHGLLDAFQVYILKALADEDHAAIILFSLMVGGMVGIISRNGGMQGIVNRIVRWADSARHACIATVGMGIAIFFDDYANTLVVGNTMRSVTDRMRVSREKLAYLVDSTAAPIAALALVTTWIGTEVGLIGDAIADIPGITDPAYILFLKTIPYSFYPLLALFFVMLIAAGRRDFGPMHAAELKARNRAADTDVPKPAVTGEEIITAKRNRPHRAINAVVPVAVLIVSVVVGLWVTGEGDTLRDRIGSSDSYKALMWASLLSVLTATLLTLSQRILDLEQIIDAWFRGLKSMLYAMIILVLAWALGQTTKDLGTAQFLVSTLGDNLAGGLLPTLVFLLAAGTAFATGSSWGTMGILMPLVIPLSWAVLQQDGTIPAADLPLLYATISGVLAGAVWGDHCSPISDTTILSSMASGCDHIEHVRTQLPYALTVGLISIVFGTLAVMLHVPWWLSLTLGALALLALYRFLGKPVPA